MDCGLRDSAGSVEEVEVAAFGGLGDVGGEEALVASGGRELAGHPRGTAGGELFFRHAQVEAAGWDVKGDQVARLDEGEWASGEGLGGDVEHAGAVGGPGHAGVGDSDHVADSGLEQ